MRARPSILAIFCITSLGLSAQTFEDHQRQANACFKAKDYDCAIKDYKKALKAEPKHPRAAIIWSDLGTALRRAGKTAEALDAYDKALKIDPKNVAILRNRASLKRVLGDLQGSLADYDTAIGIDPRDSETYMERANTRSRMGDAAGEEADLVKAVEVDPANYKAATNLALLKKRSGRMEESRADLDRIIAAHPDQPVPWNNRADLIMTMGGDLEEAMRDILKAIEVDPSYSNGYITKAEIELAQGKKEDALRSLERAVELGEDRKAWEGLFAKCK